MTGKFLRGAVLAGLSFCMLAGFPVNASADSDIWANTTSRDDEGNICIDFEEVQVLLPASWSGKCQMNINGSSVSFYQIKSRQLWTEELGYDNGGWLFSIDCTQTLDYQNLPSYMTLGTGEEGIYYASFPTDVQAYTDDEEATAEFFELTEDMGWVKEHITVTTDGSTQIVTADGDYIIPESSTEYLGEADLAGMNAEQIQMAINEIYARHHRKFLLKEVQEYFDSKDWYVGSVEADEFDVSVMNQYEGANIDLMTKRLAALKAE